MIERILVLTPWKRRWELGGSAGVPDDYYFIDGLARRGIEAHYVGPRDVSPPDLPFRNYFVHTFPDVLGATERWPVPVKRVVWPAAFTAYAVRRGMEVARRHPPSLVLGQSHLSAAAARILARRLHVPSVVKLFGVENLDRTDWPRWKYMRKNLEQVLAFKVPQDAWIILDDGTGGAAAARRHGVPAPRVHDLPNGVNLEWGDRAPDPAAAARFGIPPGTAVVLFLARLTDWKRPEVFIRAAPRVLEKSRRPVMFLLAGDGPRRADCEALAARLGVAPVVRFLGAVPHDDVPALLSVATVFASTNRRTNRGIPACEALVCGVPVVSFDVGDTRTIVRDGETGRLVAEGREEDFADAVAELVNDDALRAVISRGARDFAQRHLMGWEERVAREIAVFESVVGARAGG